MTNQDVQINAMLDHCPFCAIDTGCIQWKSVSCVAFCDAFPVTEGHTLVVPQRHVASAFDLTESEEADHWQLVAKVFLDS
jgi:diadenosine tetraphosphate (Ap4A) HIT family hydrolase